MKKSSTALLLSAVIFPGAGHLYLKKIKTGLALISISLIAIVYIISDIMRRAYNVVEQIQAGTVSPGIETITTLVTQQVGGSWVDIASYTLLACWLFGIVSCYQYSKAKTEYN